MGGKKAAPCLKGGHKISRQKCRNLFAHECLAQARPCTPCSHPPNILRKRGPRKNPSPLMVAFVDAGKIVRGEGPCFSELSSFFFFIWWGRYCRKTCAAGFWSSTSSLCGSRPAEVQKPRLEPSVLRAAAGDAAMTFFSGNEGMTPINYYKPFDKWFPLRDRETINSQKLKDVPC